MEAFVITLREGVEAALVVGLILAYLRQTGRAALRPYVYGGLALALFASLAGAVGLSLIGVNPENEVLEGTLLAIAGLLVASLVFWMWRAAPQVKAQVKRRLQRLSRKDARRQGWGLAAFTFFMVFREGVEVVLLLAALSLAAAGGFLDAVGGAAGLGLAALFGFLFVKGIVRMNLRLFFGVTGLVLAILAVRLLAGAVHEFSEVGLLPSTPAILAVVGFMVRDTTSILILMLLIVLPVLAMTPSLRRRPDEEAARPGESPPERRKRVAAHRRARRWQAAVVGVSVAIALPLGLAVYTSAAAGYRPEPLPVTAEDGRIRIAADTLAHSRLYKFVYHGPGADVRFFVIKRGEGDFVVALDACDICPPYGYHQEGDQVICDNCNAPINLPSIGMPGGCNPIPLAAALEGGTLSIDLDALEGAQSVFVT